MNDSWDVNQKMIDIYFESCKEFVLDDEKFNNFKQDSRYNAVLEHIKKEESITYISEMKSKELITDSVLEKVKENDKYGSPTVFEYDEFGIISPSTIRYLKSSLDIVDYFGNDAKYNSVLEIGGGYGGLCKVFSSLVNFSNYTLIDLPEPSKFSEKYLGKFEDIKDKISYIDTENLVPIKDLDLVISNYAFSECTKKYQEIYYETVIKNASKFYIIYNNFTKNNLNVDDFISLAFDDFEIYVEYETRPTHTNYILYGNKK
jgi:putative sugar O-methyltransferase